MTSCNSRPCKAKGTPRTVGAGTATVHPAKRPPPPAEKVTPLKVVPPSLDLEFSTALESDDEGGDEEVQIEVDKPRRSPATCEAPAFGQDAKAPSAWDTASSSSEDEGNSGEGSSGSSDSSSYFVRNADPEAVANKLGAKPAAVRLWRQYREISSL